MPYTKTNWIDRLVEFPNRFQIVNNGDGTYTLIPAPGTVTQIGTPLSAANMNKIEQGIESAHVKLDAATSAATPNTIIQRDPSGRAKVAAPSASDDIARKDTVDNAIAAHVAASDPHTQYLMKSSYTASDVLAKILTVDGAGSGLDADLLRGLAPSTSASPNTIVQRTATGAIEVSSIVMPVTGTSAVRATAPYGQSIGLNAWTKISFPNEDYDHKNEWDTTNSRFIAAETGIYLVTPFIKESSNSSVARRKIAIYKNGSLFQESPWMGNDGTLATTYATDFQIKLNAGDYVEIYLYAENAGGNINSGTNLTITRIA